jgi:mannan endo-1,4-beta-mannosidase
VKWTIILLYTTIFAASGCSSTASSPHSKKKYLTNEYNTSHPSLQQDAKTDSSSDIDQPQTTQNQPAIISTVSKKIGPNIKPLGCAVQKEVWPYCKKNTQGWGYEDGAGCISKSFCPKNRTQQRPLNTALNNINANNKTRRTFAYLHSIWGKKTLSGQKDATSSQSIDMFSRVLEDTGKAPAIMGFDFQYYMPPAEEHISSVQVEKAIIHSDRGGLVTFSWHWRAPPQHEAKSFYSRNSTFSIPMKGNNLDENSPVFNLINTDIAAIANELTILQDQNVSVLWRPLHEASGGWFWWGRHRNDGISAAQANIALWRYIYTEFTDHYKLNNIIWVWNGQHAAWYPGDKYVDIVSIDNYSNSAKPSAFKAVFTKARQFASSKKLIALSENGTIPSVDLMTAKKARWLYFMTWHDTSETTQPGSRKNFWTSEQHNPRAYKINIYNDQRILTLTDLPDF